MSTTVIGPSGPVAAPLRDLPGSPARFAPDRPGRWLGATLAAMLATLAAGLAIPGPMAMLVRALVPPASGMAMRSWVTPTLWAGYVLFVLTVILPFAVFLAWSCLGRRRPPAYAPRRWPSVSILIPAFDEQEIILDAIHGAINQDYPDFEVLVIDDGSADLTAHLAATTPARLIRLERNAGKAGALNRGLAEARGEVIVTADADSYLDPAALRHLVGPLADPTVGGVAGQVRLFHPRGALRRFQVMEYNYSQGLLKRAQCATAGTVLVAPGPVSAYRAGLLGDLGGFPDDTLTEDFDLTLMVVAAGRRVVYEPRAVAYTEAPRTDAELRRQRIRWARGGFQVLRKHRSMIGDRRRGLVGLFWLPFLIASWYAAIPITLGLTAAIPLLAWGSGAPGRFTACLGVYGLATLAVEVLTIVAGALASDWRDLRFLTHAPLFVLYKKLRLDWFTVEALVRECRRTPRAWHG